MRTAFLVLLTCALASAAACSGGSGTTSVAIPDTGLSAEFKLPDPSGLREQLPPREVSYTERDLVRFGAEFEDAMPNAKVGTTGSSATYESEWSGSGTEGLAYAMYGFIPDGFDRDPEVNLTWGLPPQETDSVFVGLANWDADRWDWFNAGSAKVEVASFDPYLTDKDDLLLVVAITENNSLQLDKVQLGPDPTFSDWQHTWGGDGADSFRGVATDKVDSVYFAGYCPSFGGGLFDGILVKYSLDGTFQWAKTWGGEQNDYYEDVAVGPDGLVYTVGKTNSFGEGSGDIVVQGWSPNGVMTWVRTWGTADEESADSIVFADNTLYICGDTDGAASESQAALLRFDTGGNKLWDIAYGGEFFDSAVGVSVGHPGPGTSDVHTVFTHIPFSGGGSIPAYARFDKFGELQESRSWIADGHSTFSISDIVSAPDSSRVFITGGASAGMATGKLLLEYSTVPGMIARVFYESDEPGWDAEVRDIAMDSTGNLLLSGLLVRGTPADVPATTIGLNDIGQLQWAKQHENGTDSTGFYEAKWVTGHGWLFAGHGADAGGQWKDVEWQAQDLAGSWDEIVIAVTDMASIATVRAPTVGVDPQDAEDGVHDTGGGANDGLGILLGLQ